ncbi:MAG TPA: fructose-bisphosphate aldolase, partial [Ruminococcaceae bacterium]|nr:fructose-bisphosphate aldolase [Oscillospiraceae bacterium]
MLVSAKEMLTKAKEGKYAVGQFNINNLEWTKAILQTAQENNSPVILGVSEGAGKYMGGWDAVVGMVNGLVKDMKITVPVALHIDHGTYEGAKAVIEAGFSSVMFDGSHYPIAENIEKTKEIIALANEKGISVEAEVGAIGGEEDGIVAEGECADPEECLKLVNCGIDFLAAGIGNIH